MKRIFALLLFVLAANAAPASLAMTTCSGAVRGYCTSSWGASGPVDFDCSGLVLWAYAQAGVPGLLATTRGQLTIDVADPAVRFGFRVAHEEERVTHG